MEDAIKTAKLKASTAKGRFHKIYNRLVEGERKKEDVIVLKMMLEELEKSHVIVEERYEALVEMMDPDMDADQIRIEEFTKSATAMQDELCKARLLIRGLEDKGNYKEIKKLSIAPIKVKLLDAPSFSGEIREYSSFKRDYDTHMIHIHGKDPYALRKC